MRQPRIPFFSFCRNRALFTLLFLAAILFLPGGAAFGATPVQENELMQFTAGGHVLGFEPDRVYVAAGDHMLSVAFSGTQGVKPVADTPGGDGAKAQPLKRVTYPGLWPGIDLIYASGQTVERNKKGKMVIPVIDLDEKTIERFSIR